MSNCQTIQVPSLYTFSSVNIFLQFKMPTVLVIHAVIPRTLYAKVTCAKVSHNMMIGHEIISTAILSLPLIQEGQLSVTGKEACPGRV